MVSQGLKVTNVERVLRFKQSRWMSGYIDINTQLRKTATTECQKDLGKLFNNSVYGKSMEDLLNRLSIKLLTNESDCQRFTGKPTFKKCTVLQDSLIALTMGKTKVTWNKPTYIGAAVYDETDFTEYDYESNFNLATDGLEFSKPNPNLLQVDVEAENEDTYVINAALN